MKRVKRDFHCTELNYGSMKVLAILHENKDDGSHVPIGIFVDEELEDKMIFGKDSLLPIDGDKENPLVEYCKRWRPFKVIQPKIGKDRVEVVAHAYSVGEGKQMALNITPIICLTGMEMRERICNQNN